MHVNTQRIYTHIRLHIYFTLNIGIKASSLNGLHIPTISICLIIKKEKYSLGSKKNAGLLSISISLRRQKMVIQHVLESK